ncbi:MAG TPA: glycosyl hydrolase [Bacteroidales bacterium]|nr:glycosyl hydrolase [Bacteroidales bacterium]
MEFATLKRIAKLVNDGAVVYGPKPVEMLSVPEIENNTDEFNQLVNALWGMTDSTENNYGKGKVIYGKPIGRVLNELNVLPDFASNVSDPRELMLIHKRIENIDAYFVFNQQNKLLHRELSFRVEGKLPEIWMQQLKYI